MKKKKIDETFLEEDIAKYIHEKWRGYYVEGRKLREMAKHFYELGFKANE